MTDGKDTAFGAVVRYTDDMNVLAGLTKREYFAAMALNGLLASRNPNTPTFRPEDDGKYVCDLADALIAALNKEGE